MVYPVQEMEYVPMVPVFVKKVMLAKSVFLQN